MERVVLTADQVIRLYLAEQVMKDDPEAEDLDFIEDSDYWYDAMHDLRGGFDEETGLPCECCRHYESKSVAKKIGDHWIGWTYWYGGGKHGEPWAVDWISKAYFLDVEEEEVTITKRTFTRKE